MFYVHRSDRADLLVTELGRVLETPLMDPMAAELVCVPSKGIERWISQSLTRFLGESSPGALDGVCANFEFCAPVRLISDVIDQVVGAKSDDGSWGAANLLWSVSQAIDDNRGEAWLALVTQQIAAGDVDGRTDRMATMQYVAELFDRYHWQRPDMIQNWQRGADVDDVGAPLRAEALWQPQLWRAVRDIVGSPSPPEVLADAVALLRGREPDLTFPERVSVFGLTRLPLGQLEVLQALAEVRDVHLFLLHPSPVLWDQTATEMRGSSRVSVSRDEGGVAAVRHPLLASWGRDARELQVATLSLNLEDECFRPASTETLTSTVEVTDTLLTRLQADLRNNRAPRMSSVDTATGVDDSIQIHSCHGAARQVEVLRDAILHAMADDPTIEPRDIVVMCPDIEAFAPHIQATFASVPQLRVRLADRAFAQTNPFMAATAQLLDLVGSRCSSAEVLAFLSAPPVRTRFDISDDDFARIEHWVAATGVRWGLSARHRKRWQMEGGNANTWHAGIQRLILGVAMSDEDSRLVSGVRPLDDVSSADIELVGQLLEFISRLEAVIDKLSDSYTVTAGISILGDAIDSLMETSYADSWQRASMFELLDELRGPATSSYGSSMMVSINEFRDLFADELVGRPSRINFRSGDVTFCTLTPMRSVPHRVVCLLGMDDAGFPRVGRRQGDDVSRRNPRIGDYDARSEDRQLLLDAVMAASQRVIVTYAGRNERTNEPLRPAVPIDELINVLEHMRGDHEGIVVEHPLQGFDVRNFVAGELGTRDPWSFDTSDLAGSRQLSMARNVEDLFIESPVPQITPSLVELEGLIKFGQHPTKAFFQDRLRLRLDDFDSEVLEDFPVETDHLLRWRLGGELLDRLAASSASTDVGELVRRWQTATVAAGEVPPGVLAEPDLDAIAQVATRIDRLRRAVGDISPGPRNVVVSFPELNVELRGVVTLSAESTIVTTTMSRLVTTVKRVHVPRAKQAMGLWIKTLALACSTGQDVVGHAVGRWASPPKNAPQRLCHLQLNSPADPHAALSDLISQYLEGLQSPPPLFSDTSLAFAFGQPDPAALVADAWTSRWGHPAEDVDRYHLKAFGNVTADELVADSDFAAYSRRLWDPVLGHLTLREVADA